MEVTSEVKDMVVESFEEMKEDFAKFCENFEAVLRSNFVSQLDKYVENKFANLIEDESGMNYDNGYEDGYDTGYDDGYEHGKEEVTDNEEEEEEKEEEE